MAETITSNAISYIKNSSMYFHRRYEWVKPLIDKVLEDELSNNYVSDFLNNMFSCDEENSVEDIPVIENYQKPTKPLEGFLFEIRKIRSIDKIINIGLLEIDKPIILNDGLNLFYGKNGSGKSSIYLSLCKTLGLDKTVSGNINSERTDSHCSITVEDKFGNQKSLQWEMGKNNPQIAAKIFDSQIAQFLVESDQVNQFEISLLKSEYFSFLHDMYDDVATLLRRKREKVISKQETFKASIEKAIPSFFSDRRMTKDELLRISFTEEDAENLNAMEAKIRALDRDDTEPIIKNINTAKSCVYEFLSLFGHVASGFDREVWVLKYSRAHFEEINEVIHQYQSKKQFLENSGIDRLAKLMPESWIKLDKWSEFIKASVNFLKTLEEPEKTKYLKQTCAYCHQPLESDEAKHLIRIYHEIQEEHENRLKSLELRVQGIADDLGSILERLEKLSENNKVVESEFKYIGRTGKIEIQFNELVVFLRLIKNSIKSFQRLTLGDELLVIQKLWEYFVALYQEFVDVIAELIKSLEARQKGIEALSKNVASVRFRRDIVLSRPVIVKFFEYQQMIQEIDQKIADISAIRQATSLLATEFSREIPMQKFKKNLSLEYENFHFTLPKIWDVTSITRLQENRRVYSLGDKRLADIFSEGERKIHALADFFASCETNSFKGVYLLDDPVNSLDDENIEVVRDRILKLVAEGNQVIVFTHNLFFLYSLIELNYEKEKINKLTRLTESIYLETKIQVGKDNELKKVYDEIDRRMSNLSKVNERDISEFDLREIYNLISGYLETYVEVVLFKEVVSRYRPNIRMHSLDRVTNINQEVIGGLLKLYNLTSRYGSRHSQPLPVPTPTYPELIGAFECFKQNYHYKAN